MFGPLDARIEAQRTKRHGRGDGVGSDEQADARGIERKRAGGTGAIRFRQSGTFIQRRDAAQAEACEQRGVEMRGCAKRRRGRRRAVGGQRRKRHDQLARDVGGRGVGGGNVNDEREDEGDEA